MSYAGIDPILNVWATKRGLLILKEENEIGRRFFHTSSPAAETFQVVIEPEREGVVRIDAHLIETWGEAEVHYVWEVPVQKLMQALDVCTSTIKIWFDGEGLR